MNPNSIPTHSYPEFLAAAGAFFSSYGVMYFMTRALTVCHFSFRFRNTGEARLGALRSVEKRDVTTKKYFKLLRFYHEKSQTLHDKRTPSMYHNLNVKCIIFVPLPSNNI